MNKKSKIFIIIVMVILLGIGIISIILNKKKESKLDSSKYIIITDTKYKTMQNDGGSHTNIYYEFDLDKNTVNIVTENYHANIISGTPKVEKNVDTKKIEKKLAKELKELLNELLANEDKKDTSNYSFYTIKNRNTTKYIYNLDSINSIKELLERIK